MYFIYSLLLVLAFLVLLPRFLYDAIRQGKYVAGFRERFGSVTPIRNDGRPVIWIHCVSVGETQAARPLVESLRHRYPNHLLAISTITLTGQNLARKIFEDSAAKIFYFPFDWRWITRKTLKAISPSAVLIMETELWPNFLRECQAGHIPVAIVNGRLSEQSFRRYRWIKSFMSRVLRSLSLAIMQTEADAHRLKKVGMIPTRTFVSGNVKFDVPSLSPHDSLSSEFRERFQLTDKAPLILAASTHAPEEKIILNTLTQLTTELAPKPRLMIAPRHPERFTEVANLLKSSGLRWVSRSAQPEASDAHAEVILLDSIGELQSAYSLASVVFVGGSIASSGGHNILEPAAAGAAVITGPQTHNFKWVVETFREAGAIIQLRSHSDSGATAELKSTIAQLLSDSAKRKDLGTRAKTLVEQNRGATQHTLDLLTAIIPLPADAGNDSSGGDALAL
jgi:3-deoxy-D-manno-octulosonic-acid transferase